MCLHLHVFHIVDLNLCNRDLTSVNLRERTEESLPIPGMGAYSRGSVFDYSILRVGAFSRERLFKGDA